MSYLPNVDRLTNGLNVIEWEHHMVHKEQTYTASIYSAAVANNGYLDVHITGVKKDCHVKVTYSSEGKGEGGYLLFVGRLGGMKGEQVAVETSKRTDIPLKLIGPGTPPDYGEYLGVMKPKERAELMGGAIAVIAPSMFPEPFCMVAIEAMMCGTPVISTPWGGFATTVEEGLTGYRCHTLGEFEQAVTDCKKLDRNKVRQRAIEKYSLQVVGPQYTRYFHRMEEIYPKM